MNSKILIAFAAGAVIASGIVYVAVKPEEMRYPAGVANVQPRPATPAPVAQADPPPVIAPPVEVQPPAIESQPVTAPAPAPAPAPVASDPLPRTQVREKPSPMRPPVPRERPAIFARNTTPQEQTSSPMPAPTYPPINKERPYNDAQPAEPAPPSDPIADPPAPVISAPAVVSAPKPAPQPDPPPSMSPLVPETRTPNTVTIQPGTILAVRMGETISAARNQAGDGFLATLERPLIVDGFIIAERGARVEGRVLEAQQPGRASGQSHLGIELTELSTSDGQRIHVRTAAGKKEAGGSTGGDLAKVGAGAAIGAAIGAAVGGGKGAGIGAGVGGAAGTADVLLTRGKPAEIPVETRISFRIQDPITLTERLQEAGFVIVRRRLER